MCLMRIDLFSHSYVVRYVLEQGESKESIEQDEREELSTAAAMLHTKELKSMTVPSRDSPLLQLKAE